MKKAFALFMAFVMVLMLIPSSALYAEGTQTEEPWKDGKHPDNNQIYYTGNAEVEPVMTGITSNVYDENSGKGIITFNGDVENIPYQAFYGKEDLTGIVLPSNLKTIGGEAFYHSSLEGNIIIPSGVETIGEYAFGGGLCLERVEIPAAVKNLGGMFHDSTVNELVFQKGFDPEEIKGCVVDTGKIYAVMAEPGVFEAFYELYSEDNSYSIKYNRISIQQPSTGGSLAVIYEPEYVFNEEETELSDILTEELFLPEGLSYYFASGKEGYIRLTPEPGYTGIPECEDTDVEFEDMYVEEFEEFFENYDYILYSFKSQSESELSFTAEFTSPHPHSEESSYFNKELDEGFTGGRLKSGNYYLTEDVTLSDSITIPAGCTVSLCLNGHVIDGGGSRRVFVVEKGAELNIHDCGTAEHRFTAPDDDSKAGLWTLDETNGNEKVTGGVITGGSTTYSGGGVYNRGTLSIFGGNIVGCSAKLGGAVYNDSSALVLKNCSFIGNTASVNGGGLFDYNGTSVSMDGVSLKYNKAASGAGVTVEPYTPSTRVSLTLSNITIEGNAAKSAGGGVFFKSSGTVYLKSGSIRNNTVSGGSSGAAGGGVYITSGNLEMSGGTIEKNTAADGGGVYISSAPESTISSGSVKENSAIGDGTALHGHGGGIYLEDSSLKLEGSGEITENTAKYRGGGVFIDGDGHFFTMHGGNIKKNHASGDISYSAGGGVYVNAGTFAMDHGNVIDNDAAKKGGGVYISTGGSVILGGYAWISGNMITGTKVSENLYLSPYKVITPGSKTGTENGNGVAVPNVKAMRVGVTGAISPEDAGGAVALTTSCGANDYSICFVSDRAQYSVYSDDSNPDSQVVKLIPVHSHSGAAQVSFSHQLNTSFTGGELESNAYVLRGDITLTDPIIIPEGETVSICLNGYVINGNRTGTVIENSGNLTIYDCNSTNRSNYYRVAESGLWEYIPSYNGTADYYYDIQQGLWKADNGYSDIPEKDQIVLITGGTITGGIGVSGGGIHNSGSLIADSVYIVGNCSEGEEDGNYPGGGIYNSGSLKLIDSLVGGNTASVGGGVYNTGAFDMEGTGSIDLNVSSKDCGGVYNSGTFTMGEKNRIDGNRAGTLAGGVMNRGTFTMKGGSISKNTAEILAGGVYNDCDFRMEGGSIRNNTACEGAAGFVLADNKDDEHPENNTTGSLTVGGDAKISGNVVNGAETALPCNLYLLSDKTVTVGNSVSGSDGNAVKPLSADALIGVTLKDGAGAVTSASNANYRDYFFSDSSDYEPFNDGTEANQTVKLRVPLHTHSWSYSASTTVTENDTLTASCTPECDYTRSDTVLIIRGTDVSYDGTAHAAVLLGADGKNAGSFLGSDVLPVISYRKKVSDDSFGDPTTDAPVTVGTYKASITCGSSTAYAMFTIEKGRVAVPVAVTGLVYNKTEQTGVILPAKAAHTLEGNKGTTAQTYNAFAYLNDPKNYVWDVTPETTEGQQITWSIARAPQNLYPPEASSVLEEKITLAEVEGEESETGYAHTYYAYSDTEVAPDEMSSVWQSSPVFEGLTPGTTYYFFAKVTMVQYSNYLGATSPAAAITTAQHVWSYTLDTAYSTDDTVTALCASGSDCVYAGADTSLTVFAENAEYDGDSHGAVLKDADGKTAVTFLGSAELPVITYRYKAAESDSYEVTEETRKVGYYKASFTVGKGAGTVTAEVCYQILPAHMHCTCGKADCGSENGHEESRIWTKWTSAITLPETAGYYYLDSDVKLNAAWNPGDGVFLCMNGHVISAEGHAGMISVDSNETLTITDCRKDAHYFTYNKTSAWKLLCDEPESFTSASKLSPLSAVSGETAVAVYGGVITGSGQGSAVDIYGRLVMNNINLAGLSSGDDSYGMICNSGGNAVLNDVCILGNEAYSASGAYNLNGASFMMTGGSVSFNIVSEDCYNSSIITVSGDGASADIRGTVFRGNQGTVYGAVDNVGGILTLDGCTIEYNDGSWCGGVNNSGKAEVKDCEIKNNTGCGVQNVYKLTLTDSAVTGNKYIYSSGNTGYAGGVITFAPLTLDGKCTITGNTSQEGEKAPAEADLYVDKEKYILLGDGFSADSEVNVILGDYDDIPYIISEDYSDVFASNADAYRVIKDDDDQMVIAERIDSQPSAENSYTVGVDESGLTSPVITYRWQKLVGEKLSDVEEGSIQSGYYGSISGDSITTQYIYETYAILIQFDLSKFEEGVMLSFKCDKDCGDIEKQNDRYYYPLSESAGTFMMLFEEEVTVTDVELVYYSDISGAVAAELPAPEQGFSYRCLVTINGTTLISDQVTVAHIHDHGETKEYFEMVSTESEIRELFTKGGKGCLGEDIVLSGTDALRVGDGKTVNLCLKGHKLDMNGKTHIVVPESSELMICDCAEDGEKGVVTNGLGEYGGAVYVEGTFRMSGIVISGNKASVCGGGIFNLGKTSLDGKCVVKDNYSYSGEAVIDANKVRDNLFTNGLIEPQNEAGALTAGSEIWVTLAETEEDNTVSKKQISGSIADNAPKAAAEMFRSDADAYKICFEASEAEEEKGGIRLVSRISQQPDRDHDYTVGVDMSGLSYSAPSYRWNQTKALSCKLSESDMGADDFSEQMSLDKTGNTIVSAFYSGTCNAEVWFTAPKGTEYVTFTSAASGFVPYSENYIVTKTGDVYTVRPLEEVTDFEFDLFIFGTGGAFTINDVTFHYSGGTEAGGTGAQLLNGELGNGYFCEIIFADDSVLKSDIVYVPHVNETDEGEVCFDRKITSESELIALFITGGSAFLGADITLTNSLAPTLYRGKEVSLCLNDHIITGSGKDSVLAVYGTLNLYDCDTDELTRYFTDSICEHGKAVGEDCDECGTCEHGTVYGDYCEECEQYVEEPTDSQIAKPDGFCETLYTGEGLPSGDYIAVTGGIITGGIGHSEDNYSTRWGGGIYLGEGAALNLYGGSIAANRAHNGGAVFVNFNAVFTMTGGCISACAADSGGAVFVKNSGTFSMYDGIISACSAEDFGGAMSTVGEILMYGGKITGCSAGCGGAVDCSSGTFHMFDGEISGNRALFHEYRDSGLGGGIYNEQSSCSFHMHGGSITGNYAETAGGGVYNGLDCTFDGKCIVRDNYAYYGKEVNVSNRLRDNVFTSYPLLIGNEEGSDSIAEGSEIWVTLASVSDSGSSDDYSKPKYRIEGEVTFNGTEEEASCFYSDVDAYQVKYVKESGEETGHIELISRIDQQPAKANDFTVHVGMDGLTEAMGYSDPADSEKDPVYQWVKVTLSGTELKDATLPEGIDDGTIVTDTNSIEADYYPDWSQAEIAFQAPEGTDSICFTIDSSYDFEYDTSEYTVTRDGGRCSFEPIYGEADGSIYFDIVICDTDAAFTIDDVQFMKLGAENINDTDSALSSDCTAGETYFCEITFKDGSKLESEKTVYESEAVHTHNWAYTVNGNQITATCSSEGHTGTNPETVTVTKPTLETYGQTGEGISAEASLSAGSVGGESDLEILYQKYEDGTWKDLEEAPTDAGTYRACVSVGEGEQKKTACDSYVINKKQLTVTGTSTSNKTYDGTVSASATIGTVGGKLTEDSVTVEIDTKTFSDRNVGSGKTVTVTYRISGDDAANYLKPVKDTLTADITAREIAVSAVSKSTKAGAELAELTYSYKASDLCEGDEFTGSLSTDANKDIAGSYNITQGTLAIDDDNDGQNYTILFTQGTYTVKAVSTGKCTCTETLRAGTDLVLVLGSKEAGTFTITGSSCKGFTLRGENGEYLAVSGGALTGTGSAYTWKYDGGLYTEVKTTEKCCSGKGWYRGRTTTKTVTTRYYLSCDESGLIITSCKVCACIRVTADEHTWTYLHNGDGKHEALCTKCGYHDAPETHDFTYDAENHKCICGLVDPDFGGVTDVSVKESAKTTTVTSRGGSGCGYRGKSVKITTRKTTYTYTISTKQTNVTVKKIEYSPTKDGTMTKVSCQKFTSDTKLGSFYIDVTDSNGNVTHWFYNGTKTLPVQESLPR